MRLSEGLRLWLERFGLKSDFHSIRSNAHLILYFLFGIVLCLYGRECGWSWWVIILNGCSIGLIDESIKVLLATRELTSLIWLRTGAASYLPSTQENCWLIESHKKTIDIGGQEWLRKS